MKRTEIFYPVLFVLLWVLHGALFGLTDDEAYYWVLAQKLDYGYAYHPPMVAWLIGLSDLLIGGLFSHPESVVVRFPGAICMGIFFYSLLSWLKEVNPKERAFGVDAFLILLSFGGLVGVSWMMVPDLPLVASWAVLFLEVWRWQEGRQSNWSLFRIFLAVFVSLMSKYSAILFIFSAFVSLLITRPKEWVRPVLALVVGAISAGGIVLLWNYHHEWVALLYQFRDRHSQSSLSWLRYGQFWVTQLILAGPALVTYSFVLFRRGFWQDSVQRYLFLWFAPAAFVFCLQPLLSSYKPHWAFVVWIPVLVGMAYDFVRRGNRFWIRAQKYYGLFLVSLITLACHLPIQGWVTSLWSDDPPNPLWDVTNDLYGWSLVREEIEKSGVFYAIGSRYQTASQLAFVMGDMNRVNQVPRSLREKDDWVQIPVSTVYGPHWPPLVEPAIYVADNRYSAAPEYPQTNCKVYREIESRRWGLLAKRFTLWKCVPRE